MNSTYAESGRIKAKPAYWIVGIALVLGLGLPLVTSGSEWTEKEITGLAICAALVLPICAWIIYCRLVLKLSQDGIHYQFKGMQLKPRFVRWQQLESWRMRPVSAFGEFGGWGLRTNLQSWGYMTGTPYALELNYKDGKVRVISIEHPAKVRQWLEANNLNPISAPES